MPKLLATAQLPGADVRIVSVSSAAHRTSGLNEGIRFGELKTEMLNDAGRFLYGQSMLAKVLLARELARRYPQITTASLHPGTVKSEIWSGEKDLNFVVRALIIRPLVALTGVSNEEGAKTQLWLSFSSAVENGRYYEPVGKLDIDGKYTKDDNLARKLWEWTEKELAAYGAPGWPVAS